MSSHPYAPIPDDDLQLPASLQTEVTILGAMLLDAVAVNDALAGVQASDFLLDSHQKVFRAISGLMELGHAVDLITVMEELQRRHELEAIGGPAYLAYLTEGIPRNANIQSYVRIIKNKSLLRQVMAACNLGLAKASDQSEDATVVLNDLQQQLMELSTAGAQRDLKRTSDVVRQNFPSVDDLYAMGRDFTGLRTHYVELDKATCGLQKGELIIVAARPSMGKTSLAINIAENASMLDGKTVAIFSLEMGDRALVQRMVASQARVGGRKLQRGFLSRSDRQPLYQALERMIEAELYIDESPNMTIQEMRAKCRRLKQRSGALDLIVVDYIQLMTGGHGGRRAENRTQEVSSISRGLKVLAKEMDVPVVALSQLNRSSETRSGDKRPMLSDLRESGSLEQDADLVAFIHRPEYYDREDESLKGKAEIIIAKQRNGPVGKIELTYVAETTRFENAATTGYGGQFND